MPTNNEFRIVELYRITIKSEKEKPIFFEPGINLIEGGPNTGKTTWLQCLNYLLGAENPIEHYFTDDFLDNYRAIEGKFIVNSKKLTIRRDWTISGQKSKISYNGKIRYSDGFQLDLVEKFLQYPNLKYPKNDPVSAIRATNLSFRMHFRHLYRQQKYWSDIVEKQPPGEFRACLLNFLGIAEKIYTDSFFKFHDLSDELNTANEVYKINKNKVDTVLSVILDSFDPVTNDDRIRTTYKSFLELKESDLNTTHEKINGATLENIIEKIREDGFGAVETAKLFDFFEDAANLYRRAGQTEERINILKRFESIISDFENSYKNKNRLAEEITPYHDALRPNLNSTEIESKLQTFCEEMDTYLDQLNILRPHTWKHHGRVNMVLYRNHIDVRIGGRSWNNILGGTDALYFFLSYQYALLAMSSNATSRIPQIIIVDLPPDLSGETLTDSSFVIEPFYTLVKQENYRNSQVIFAGHTFNSLRTKERESLFSSDNISSVIKTIEMDQEYLARN